MAAGAALWGTDTVLRRPLVDVLPPLQLVFWEHVVLALVVAPIVLAHCSSVRKIRARTWVTVVAIGWIGSAGATVLFSYAIRAGNPTTAVLLQKLQPLFAIALARLLLDERWHRAFPPLALVAVGGGYLISFGGENVLAPFAGLDAIAAVMAVGAAAGWGTATVLGRMVAPQIAFELLTALRILCALPVLALVAFVQGPVVPARGDFIPLVPLSLLPGFAALMLYYRGLRETPAMQATLGELAFPATAAVLNWAVLGAEATLVQGLGFAVVWGCIFYLRWRSDIARAARC